MGLAMQRLQAKKAKAAERSLEEVAKEGLENTAIDDAAGLQESIRNLIDHRQNQERESLILLMKQVEDGELGKESTEIDQTAAEKKLLQFKEMWKLAPDGEILKSAIPYKLKVLSVESSDPNEAFLQKKKNCLLTCKNTKIKNQVVLLRIQLTKMSLS